MSITLTRVPLDLTRSGTRRKLASEQVMHAVIAAATDAGVERRVLWRIDGEAAQRTLYVVSPGVPDTSRLSQELLVDEDAIESRAYQPLLDSLSTGQEFRFRLRANPIINKYREGRDQRSARVPLVGLEAQLGWLERQAERHGFELARSRMGQPEVLLHGQENMQFSKQNGRIVTIRAVVFEGILRVTDAELVRSALVSGVGPAKAYGCGLLTLAPVSGLHHDV